MRRFNWWPDLEWTPWWTDNPSFYDTFLFITFLLIICIMYPIGAMLAAKFSNQWQYARKLYIINILKIISWLFSIFFSLAFIIYYITIGWFHLSFRRTLEYCYPIKMDFYSFTKNFTKKNKSKVINMNESEFLELFTLFSKVNKNYIFINFINSKNIHFNKKKLDINQKIIMGSEIIINIEKNMLIKEIKYKIIKI